MVTFRANIYGPLDREMVALQLCMLLQVFTQRNLVAYFSVQIWNMLKSTRFARESGSLSANISGGKGQLPATPVRVESLEISLFLMV